MIVKFSVPTKGLIDLTHISNKKIREFATYWVNEFFDSRTEEQFNVDLMNALQQIAHEKLIKQ